MDHVSLFFAPFPLLSSQVCKYIHTHTDNSCNIRKLCVTNFTFWMPTYPWALAISVKAFLSLSNVSYLPTLTMLVCTLFTLFCKYFCACLKPNTEWQDQARQGKCLMHSDIAQRPSLSYCCILTPMKCQSWAK